MRIILLILEREEKSEGRWEWRRESENDQSGPPICTPTGDRTHNPGICPHWASDPQPFGIKDDPTIQ